MSRRQASGRYGGHVRECGQTVESSQCGQLVMLKLPGDRPATLVRSISESRARVSFEKVSFFFSFLIWLLLLWLVSRYKKRIGADAPYCQASRVSKNCSYLLAVAIVIWSILRLLQNLLFSRTASKGDCMNKKKTKRLTLAKETLLQLHDQRLSEVMGAATLSNYPMISCDSCVPANCDPGTRTCPP